MRRRDFLATGAATAGGLLLPRRANAAWGEAPAVADPILLQPGVRAERCLEIFLYGGMGVNESFYVVPEYGAPDDPNPALQKTGWHLFSEDHASIFGECGFGPSSGWLTPFATDSLGVTVNLGPIVTPLKSRQDILDRMRIVVLQHEFLPHEVAIPYGLCGLRLGNPRMAGMAAHVQRYWLDQDTTGRVIPWSFVLRPSSDDARYNIHTATDVGMHPGSARPLELLMSDQMDLGDLLGRKTIGADASRLDPLLLYYGDEAVARYTSKATGVPYRSRTITDHQFALRTLVDAPLLQELLDPSLFVTPPGASCDTIRATDPGAMTLGAAVALLTDPATPARYATVIEGGIISYSALPYDSHADHLSFQSTNVSHMLAQLASHINLPGENDPAKLDLDDTMILITTEFGRTPYEQAPAGTNHFPYGYVNILIGGPVQPGVTGALGPDGHAVSYVNPSELRAGVLAGLGIYPFSPESFAVGDLQGISNELDGLIYVQQQILGRLS
jgi:hypothetical protein